jgi:hypothetical protein
MVAKCTPGRIATNGCVSAGHAIAYNIELRLLVRSADAARPPRLEGAPLRDVAGWLEQYREIWEGRLDRLAHHLQHIQRKAEGDE